MKTILVGFSIPIVSALLLIGFNGFQEINPNNNSNISVNKKQEITVRTHSDFPVTNSLKEMAEQSRYIVIGHYEGFDSKWNMARNPQNISIPDEKHYVEGYLYNFKIDRVLKGKFPENNIKINITHSRDIMIRDDNGSTMKVSNEDSRYLEPELQKNYILFLNKDEFFNNYFGSLEPFQIQIDKEGKALLKSNVITKNNKEFMKSNAVELKDKKVTVITEVHSIIDTITGESLDKLTTDIEAWIK